MLHTKILALEFQLPFVLELLKLILTDRVFLKSDPLIVWLLPIGPDLVLCNQLSPESTFAFSQAMGM